MTFHAVINPSNGPGGPCPNSDYVPALAELNSITNIQTLAYVHTANSTESTHICGDGKDPCPCSRNLADLELDISTWQHWNNASACGGDYHIDGIFFDESPSDANCTAYMSSATAFAKKTLMYPSTVLFNAGTKVDPSYWSIADYINVFENADTAYWSANISALDDFGRYSTQSTMIIHDYVEGSKQLREDVATILSFEQDAMAGLYITDLSVYSEFPTDFMCLVGDVAKVVEANKAYAAKQ